MSDKSHNIRDRIKELRRVRAGDLIPHEQNWREHPQNQQDAMQAALLEIGYADALLVRETDDGLQIIDGHLRAGMDEDQEVPVLILDLDEIEAKKLLLTLDPLAGMAVANEDILAELTSEIEFDEAGLAEVVASLSEPEKPEIIEDEVPEPPAVAISKPGDLWQLGEHRVLCGDSTKAEDVERLMGGEKAGLCFTSPPYAQQRDYTDASDVSDWDQLMRGVFGCLRMQDNGQVLVNLGMVHRDGEWQPYWDGWIEWMREQGWKRFGWYVWDKLAGTPGDTNGRLRMTHEWVFHFCKIAVPANKTSKCKHAGDLQVNKGMRGKDGVVNTHWTQEGEPIASHKVMDSVIRATPAMGGYGGHPAPFGIKFAAEVLPVYGGSIYDPFLGSGTTLIAAEQLNRKCYGIEIEPLYVDVIVKRWEQFTGGKAELIEQ